MNKTPPETPSSTLDIAAWRALARWLLQTHSIECPADTLEGALRRLAQRRVGRPVDDLAWLLQQVGLEAVLVERPLDEVLRDAHPSHPWITFGAADTQHEPIAILDARRQRPVVVQPMSSPRRHYPALATLTRTLGVPDVSANLVWLIASPVAPLDAMRSPAAEPASPWHRLRALLMGERQTLWVALVYSIVIGLLSLVVPIAVQSLVNTIAFGSVLQPLVVLTLLVAVALGVSTVINALRAGVVEIIQRSLFARTAIDVTHRLLSVRVEAFDRYHGPELVNRFFDVVTVQKSASLLLIDGLSIVMQTVIGMVLLALYHPWLLAFDVLLVAAMLFIVFVLGRGAVGTAINESKAKYALEAWLEQIATHLVTFKSMGGATYATHRSQVLLDEYLAYRAKHFRILLRQIIGSFALQALASSALLGIGGWLVINRQLTLGQLVASELIVALMVSAFTKFGKQLEVFYDLLAAIDKLGALVDLPLEHVHGEGRLSVGQPLSVTLRGVEVRYEDSIEPAVAIAALDVAPGERLGVTGRVGAGKSTFADLLFGLRPPSRGAVLVDDVDMRTVPPAELREHVSLVRDLEIFPGSIVDNVRLGRDDLSLADVTDALRRVDLLDELLDQPDGLSTLLHPNGRPLSTGQAWRLMLARAIVGQPRLLIIDGLLDRLDLSHANGGLLDALVEAGAPWTLVCFSEHPAVLARCSRVVALEDGQLREGDVPTREVQA